MAKRRPTQPGTPTPPTTGEDAFAATVLRFLGWAQTRTQTLIVLIVVLVVVAVGSVYWYRQRSAQLDAAAGELEQLQQSIAFDDLATAQASLAGYLERYGGTSYEVEARLLLARVHLVSASDPTSAIEVLQAVAPDFGSPIHVDATFMLAAAFEQAGRWGEASGTYRELMEGVDFEFQEMEAMAGLARSQLASGDTASAVQAYQEILELLDSDAPDRSWFEMRVAELTAGEG